MLIWLDTNHYEKWFLRGVCPQNPWWLLMSLPLQFWRIEKKRRWCQRWLEEISLEHRRQLNNPDAEKERYKTAMETGPYGVHSSSGGSLFPMVDQSAVPCAVTCQVTFVNRGQSAFDWLPSTFNLQSTTYIWLFSSCIMKLLLCIYAFWDCDPWLSVLKLSHEEPLFLWRWFRRCTSSN